MKDRIKGTGNEMKGKMKDAIGRVSDDQRMRGEGAMEQAKGTLQKGWDSVKRTGRDIKEDVKGVIRDRDREGDRLDKDVDDAA